MALLRRLTGEQRRNVAHWAMELVVVVAGVLIAMWLQEIVEQRREKSGMAVAEAAIRTELRSYMQALIWREAIAQCHIDRAKLLKNLLGQGGRSWPGITESALIAVPIGRVTGVEMVVSGVYARPNDDFSDNAWTSALATGALAPMDRDRFAKLAEVYSTIAQLRRNLEREDRAASMLSALSVPQEITPETRSRMYQALYELDTSRFVFLYTGASALADQMKQLGWNDKAEIDRHIAEDEAAPTGLGAPWRPCVKRRRNPFNDLK